LGKVRVLLKALLACGVIAYPYQKYLRKDKPMKKRESRKNNPRNQFRFFIMKRFYPLWQDVKWPVVGAIWGMAIALGYSGFNRYYLSIGETASTLDFLYQAVQLTVLESGNILGPIPWQLEAARFLMPVLAGYTAVQALLVVFRDQWQLLRVRFFKNHAVICGLGERGFKFAQEFLEYGFKVVIVEKNGGNPFIDDIRTQGAVVITGDAADINLFRKSGVQRSRYLVAVCSDDSTNTQVALNVRHVNRLRKAGPLTAFIHLVDLDLCNLLSGWSLAATENNSLRLEFFNVLERGAHVALKNYFPFLNEPHIVKKQPRILMVGLDKMGESLITQAARNWWLKNANGKLLRISVIDKTASKKIELLKIQYPQIEKVCTIDSWQIEKGDPEFEKGDFLFDGNGCCDVDAVYVSFENDGQVLINTLTLHQKIRENQVPIVARMSRDAGLSALMKDDSFNFGHIHIFNFLEQACSLESLLGGAHERIARAIHENYVQHQKESGVTSQTNLSMVDWEELPEDMKESNRHQAAHVEAKLKTIGCGIQPLTDWEAASFAFTPAEVEQLAEVEHERWCEERRGQGWSYSPKDKSMIKKTSPYLVPWEQLSDAVKEYDRNMVRNLPNFLARVGLQIFRNNL
jgi:hypothetical protein